VKGVIKSAFKEDGRRERGVFVFIKLNKPKGIQMSTARG
jgi:hypothetical protein